MRCGLTFGDVCKVLIIILRTIYLCNQGWENKKINGRKNPIYVNKNN